MIQRIQTVYLLLIAILSGLTVGLPVASLVNAAHNYLYIVDVRGVSLITSTGDVFQTSTSMITTCAAVAGILALVVLFSYKNRVKQIRLSVINFIFMIAYYPFYAYYMWSACDKLDAQFHIKLAAVFPLVSIILNYLAIGNIGKDEKLVKSLDRLR